MLLQCLVLLYLAAILDAANLDSVPRSPVSVSVVGVDKLPPAAEEEEKVDEVELDDLRG